MHWYSGFRSQGQITKREVQIKTWISNALDVEFQSCMLNTKLECRVSKLLVEYKT